MKLSLLLVGLLFSFNANALAWAMPNEASGQIVITDGECWLKGTQYDKLYKAYARTYAGETFNGCWYYKDTMVHIVYESGTERTYKATDFTKLE